MTHRGSRYVVEKFGHFSARAAFREALQVLPAGIHQSDDDRGEFLPEHDCRGHGQRCDDIESDFPVEE